MALSTNKQMLEDIDELRNDLKTYRPGKESKGVHGRKEVQFPEHLCIGLFGRTGIGKTSLINSLKFAVSGSFREGKWLPVATLEKAGGHTLKRVIAPLTDNISVIDNRGFADLTRDGTAKEIEAQIDGKRGYSAEVKWENPIGAADEDIEVYNRKDAIGCAIFVFSALENTSQSTNGLHQVVLYLQAKQGRYPVAVITNVDRTDRESVKKLTSILQVIGISEIYEVANITKDKAILEIPYQHNLLSLLERCMTDGDEAAVFKHNQQKEEKAKMDRKEKQEQEQKSKDAFETKVAVATGVGVMGTTTGTGAAIGMVVGGPIGSAVGAGIGATVGGTTLLVGKIVKKITRPAET